MGKAGFASALSILLLSSIFSIPWTCAADTPGIESGDWWEYAYDYEYDLYLAYGHSLNATGTIRFTVQEPRAAVIDGANEQVLTLGINGQSRVQGTVHEHGEYGSTTNYTVDANITLSGSISRRASDFSLVDSQFHYSEKAITTVDYGGGFPVHPQSTNFSATVALTYTKPLDDYAGDLRLDPYPGSVSQAPYSFNAILTSDWDEETNETSGTYSCTIAQFQQSAELTVPAGTFDCLKLMVTQDVDGQSKDTYWYYSAEVGNYVQFDAQSMFGGLLGDDVLKLKAYSYDPPTSGLFSDPLLLALIVGAAVAVVAAVVLVMRRRK